MRSSASRWCLCFFSGSFFVPEIRAPPPLRDAPNSGIALAIHTARNSGTTQPVGWISLSNDLIGIFYLFSCAHDLCAHLSCSFSSNSAFAQMPEIRASAKSVPEFRALARGRGSAWSETASKFCILNDFRFSACQVLLHNSPLFRSARISGIGWRCLPEIRATKQGVA